MLRATQMLQNYYNQKWAAIYRHHCGDQCMSETKPLPKYLCHKEVRALKIREVHHVGYGKYLLLPVDESYHSIPVDAKFVDRFGPTPGSYYVVYEDGYTSISPAKSFEEGYTRQPD